MSRLLIWPAVLILPLSIYGVIQSLPTQESPWLGLAYAILLDLSLVSMIVLRFRKRFFSLSDGTLTIVLLASYLLAPLFWAVLALDSVASLEERQQRFELMDIRRDPASDDRHLFLWTGYGIRRESFPDDGRGHTAAPGDSATLFFETGLFGLEKITDVRIP